MRTRSSASSILSALGRPTLGLMLAALANAANASAAPTYTVLDLGVPDDSTDPSLVQALGLNDLGEVTGQYALSGGGQHAFLYSQGVMRDLGTLGGSSSVGFAVNASSQVTASSGVSDSSSDEHAFLHNGVFMQDLGTLGGSVSQGRGINASGEVTGEAALDATVRHAFRFNGTFMEDLGVLDGSSSHGFAINDTGMITGGSTSEAGPMHAFFYDGVQMHDLSTLGGAKSFGSSVNDDGLVVGTSDIDQTTLTHAFLWDGAMHDLNDLVTDLPPGVAIELQSAQYGGSINQSGQIAATGRYLSGGPQFAMRAFLLTPVPVPEPATTTSDALAPAALASIAVARRRRGGIRQPVS